MDLFAVQVKPATALFLIIVVLWLCHLVSVAIYRLYFSSVAHFPGPKLAALTWWYEFYYEVVLPGQFTFHIQDLHKKYGPIVRITPEELHIQDHEFYDELYVKPVRADKYELWTSKFGTPDAFFATSSHDHHRIRRAAVNPLFSRKRIVDFQPVIRAKLDKLCYKIKQFHESGREFNLYHAWAAYAGDVVTEFSFGICEDHLDVPDFEKTFHEPMAAACQSATFLYQFPFLWPVLKSFPDWLLLKIQPIFYLNIKMQRDFKQLITDIKEDRNEAHKNVQHRTLFHEMQQSELPPEEKTVTRMVDDAQTLIGAGILTTAWALTVASFHIVNSPEKFGKLRAELLQAVPDPSVPLDWLKLEQLPYLSACVKEGIRLSYGVASRSPRVLSKPLNYRDWVIPPRTPVSMSIVDMNQDEEIFPDWQSFTPERWLDNPKAKDGSNLGRYFVSFSKGTRSCIGLNLAQAEIHLGLAALFRQFSFDLYETDVTDTLLAHDYFMAQAKFDSKGVRVKVKSIDL